MRKATLASFALAALATSFVAPGAHAGPPVPGPSGRICGYNAVSDPAPDADADAMTGEAHGGPATWDRPFTLHCIVQVDSNVHNGSSNDAAEVSCAATATPAGYEAHCQGTINYISGEDSQDYLCTEVTYSGGTLYWHPTDDKGTPSPLDDEAGHWTTDSTKPCSAATQFSTGPIIDLLNALVFEPLDSLAICPALRAARPVVNGLAPSLIWIDSEGDLFIDGDGDGINEADAESEIFWDCPTYIADGDAAAGGIIDA